MYGYDCPACGEMIGTVPGVTRPCPTCKASVETQEIVVRQRRILKLDPKP